MTTVQDLVLLVEDDDDQRAILERFLERALADDAPRVIPFPPLRRS